ncbi:7352_t:CDS:2 [Scutellospora calospora]|uniref:7352_t:CDS:1 n=1 Tax=Scutellospora calospora TaxID=85575 RepID=A0ACA9M100_9GLOM|nr:7352_t:CDS:2 [Scutellospora calospora]
MSSFENEKEKETEKSLGHVNKFFEDKSSILPFSNEIPTQLIDKCERGFKFNEDKSIRQVSRKALDIDISNFNQTYRKVEETNELNYETNDNYAKQKLKHFKTSTENSQERWEMAEITLDSCVKPTNYFIEDVKNALKKSTNSDKIKELRNIIENYGSFYAFKLVFGKAIIKTKISYSRSEDVSKVHNSEAQLGGGLTQQNAELKVSNEVQSEEKSIYSNSTAKIETVGGEDYTNWEVIRYDDFHIIFDLLNCDSYKDLWKQIIDILGYRILSAGVETLNFNPRNRLPFEFGTEITKIKNLSKCHIYASIVNENENITKAFSLHVDFVDEHTPEIFVHLIRHKKGKTKVKHYKLKVCWIVVGKPADVDFDMAGTEYPVILRSYKYSGFQNKNNIMQIPVAQDIKDIPKHAETCILSTCVLESYSETNRSIDRSKPIFVGTYFSFYEKFACLYAYNSKGEASIDPQILQRFTLHFCDKKRKLSYGVDDRKKILPIKCNENLVFVNQVTYCSDKNCKHNGFINVNLHEIIYGSFDSHCMNCVNEDCEDCHMGKIAYLKFPLEVMP